MRFRAYRAADEGACLGVFNGNTLDFFAPPERAEYEAFLRTLDEPYFVLEEGSGEVVACGGVYIVGDRAGLSWGMVARPYHRRGVGRRLLEGRLEYLRAHYPEVSSVHVNTSQRVAGFFERFGFVTQKITEDAFAPGLHEHVMTLVLEPNSEGRGAYAS